MFTSPSVCTVCYSDTVFTSTVQRKMNLFVEENWEPKRMLLPCPVPMYTPTPVAMYSTPAPYPILVPVPIPVPCFIPTSRKTSKSIYKKIKVSSLTLT